jgi:N-acetyl-D-muramate 6-phosphate phosphatase
MVWDHQRGQSDSAPSRARCTFEDHKCQADKKLKPMPLTPSRIRLICFDIDGTLSDTDNQMVNRFERYLHPFRLIYPHRNTRAFARRIVMGMESPGNFLFTFLDAIHLDDAFDMVMNALSRHRIFRRRPDFWLIKGVYEMLAALQQTYPMVVISARNNADTQAFLDQYNLQQFFQRTISAHTCAHTKPYPDPILFAAKEFGVLPEEILMVGDTTVDIRAARSAGAQSVGVLCGFGEERELIAAGADMILPTTMDLVDILNHLRV